MWKHLKNTDSEPSWQTCKVVRPWAPSPQTTTIVHQNVKHRTSPTGPGLVSISPLSSSNRTTISPTALLPILKAKLGCRQGETWHIHTPITGVCMAGRYMIQLVVVENVLSLLYPDSRSLRCIGPNFPVPSNDQHLEGGHGRGKEQYAIGCRLRALSQPCSQAVDVSSYMT